MILEEFDENEVAIINPTDIYEKKDNFPETIISIFSYDLFNRILDILNGEKIAEYKDIDGIHPIYRIIYKNNCYGFVKARLGAAACVGSFEDVIALGVKRIILLGNCGVLDKNIDDCEIIIPTKAIRDEGTSYHYMKASETIDVNLKYINLFKEILNEYNYSYVEGTTWTTDAFYRETRNKVEKRKKQGAICVEMECASMQAMCNFRKIDFFQFLYAGDNLDKHKWDPRSLNGLIRLNDKEKIALLAFELANKITERESKYG